MNEIAQRIIDNTLLSVEQADGVCRDLDQLHAPTWAYDLAHHYNITEEFHTFIQIAGWKAAAKAYQSRTIYAELQMDVNQLRMKKRIDDLWKYVGETGFWFASNSEQKELAEFLCQTGKLQQATKVVNVACLKGFYIPTHIKAKAALPSGLYNLVTGRTS